MQLAVKTKVYIVVGGASAVSFTAGAITSYFVTRRILDAKYEALLDEELAASKKFYSRVYKQEEYSDPVDLAERNEYTTAVDALSYGSIVSSDKDVRLMQEAREEAEAVAESEARDPFIEVEPSVDRTSSEETINIFEEEELSDAGFDLEAEAANRASGKPYVVTHDEFYVNERDYEQSTLTYFEEDDLLCDEQDVPIEDTDGVVNDTNLTRFGDGSKDNNVVYIRNDRLSMMFEVVKSKGSYAKNVLGFIEHADHQGVRKFRRDHE